MRSALPSRLAQATCKHRSSNLCGGYEYDSTCIRLQFDHTTSIRWFDDLRHDGASAARPESVSRSAWLRLAGQRPFVSYVTVTLVTFDKQSNARRVEVDHHITLQRTRPMLILKHTYSAVQLRLSVLVSNPGSQPLAGQWTQLVGRQEGQSGV